MKLKIAFLQIAPCGNSEDNLRKGEEACRRAKEMGADIALFPEMFSCGYDIYDRPPEVWTKDAIPSDGDFVSFFGALAKELDMLRNYRAREVHGNAYRRPEKYGILSENIKTDPFIRG